MRSRLLVLTLFVAALLTLQQGLLWLDTRFDIRRQQNALVAAHDIEPAALFYMELKVALQAEKSVRASVAEVQAAP